MRKAAFDQLTGTSFVSVIEYETDVSCTGWNDQRRKGEEGKALNMDITDKTDEATAACNERLGKHRNMSRTSHFPVTALPCWHKPVWIQRSRFKNARSKRQVLHFKYHRLFFSRVASETEPER